MSESEFVLYRTESLKTFFCLRQYFSKEWCLSVLDQNETNANTSHWELYNKLLKIQLSLDTEFVYTNLTENDNYDNAK